MSTLFAKPPLKPPFQETNFFLNFIENELADSFAVIFFIYMAKMELKLPIYVPQVENKIISEVKELEDQLKIETGKLQTFVINNFAVSKELQNFWSSLLDKPESYLLPSQIRSQLENFPDFKDLKNIDTLNDLKNFLNPKTAENVLNSGRVQLNKIRNQLYSKVKAAIDKNDLDEFSIEIKLRLQKMILQFDVSDKEITSLKALGDSLMACKVATDSYTLG